MQIHLLCCRAVISWRLDDSLNATVIYCKCGSNEGVSKLASIWFVGTHGSCVRVMQGAIKSLCSTPQYVPIDAADARAVRPYKIA